VARKQVEVRVIKQGRAQGPVLVSDQAISFYGGVDLTRGVVSESGHPLEGRSLAGTIVVFPTGKGSTVGSYALYRLARSRLAPAALVMEHCQAIVATGAIMAGIPCVDGVRLEQFEGVLEAELDGAMLSWEQNS